MTSPATSRRRDQGLSVVVGPDGIIRSGNDAFLSAAGLTDADLGVTSILSVLHPWDVPVMLECIFAMSRGVASAAWECRMLRRAGGTTNVAWTAVVDASPGTVSEGTFTARGVDITSERPAQESLLVNEAQLRTILAFADAAVWEGEVGSDRIHLDRTGAGMLGFEAGTGPVTWQAVGAHLHVDDRRRFASMVEDLVSGEPVGDRFRLLSGSGLDPGGEERSSYVAIRGRTVIEPGGGSKPVGVVWNVSDQVAVEQELLTLAMSDPLTGVHNRRAFDQELEREWARASRNRSGLGMLMIDIDDFKALNDRYGHEAGDVALVGVARVLQDCLLRATDVLARYGGEEFVVLLPDVDGDGATVVGRRIVDACLQDQQRPASTVSVGAALRQPDDASPWDVLRRADNACYQAKRAGKAQFLLTTVDPGSASA